MRKKATFLPAQPRRAKTRLVPGKAAAKSATRRIMSVTFADAGEAVSRQCLQGESSHSYPPTLSLPGQALFPMAVR